MRYQRPCQDASPHGWTRRAAGLALAAGAVVERDGTWRSTTAFLAASKAGSVVRSRGSMPMSESHVALDAGGLELAQRLGGGPGQGGVRPGAAGQAEHGELVGLEGDVGQGVLALVDAVAGLVVPDARRCPR